MDDISNPYMSAKTYIRNPYAVRPTEEQMGAVSKCSSRLRKDVPRIQSDVLPFDGVLRLEADVALVTPALVRKSVFSPERVDYLLKPLIKEFFDPFDMNLKLADESKKLREPYQQKLKVLLSNPPPQDDFRSAHKLCDMSPSTYVDAEFLLGMKLFDERTEFSLSATFDLSPEPISVTIPEPLLRKWIAEVREEIQAEEKSGASSN